MTKKHIDFTPFHFSIAFHIETSHLICKANQMTGFYMKYKTGLKWVYEMEMEDHEMDIEDHLFGPYVKYSEKLIFLTPCYILTFLTPLHTRIRG